MTAYRRAHLPGATWFFAVNLAQRHGNPLLVERIADLRQAFRSVQARHPFRMEADFARHVDYIHWNPVKHGWVRRVVDWPHSSFHDYVARACIQRIGGGGAELAGGGRDLE